MKTYEAMFMMDASLASDWSTAESEIKRILERAEARILGLRNWDERKLAYSIGPHKRGLYALAFFETSPDKITGIERDAQLSEKIVRVLVLRHETLTPEQIEKAMTAPPPPKAPPRPSDEYSAYRGRPAPDAGAREPAAVAVEEAIDIEVPPDLE